MLRRFPRLEHSYDKVIHKKVPSHLYLLLPKGERAWIWFTYTGGKNACFVVKGKEITLYTTCFADDLALGTILPGVLFKVNGHTHFACIDIVHYEGNDISGYTFKQRMAVLTRMFQTQIKQTPFFRKLIIGVAVITKSFEEAQQHAETVPYSVHGIKHLCEDGSSNGVLSIKENIVREAVFNVRADIQNDIYHLHCANDSREPLTAAVPSYKRSVALNSIFRHIKENKNLDALEESDDEAEFEDVREERYVNLRKQVMMRCIYHKRFNKWEPVQIVKGRQAKLVTAAQLR